MRRCSRRKCTRTCAGVPRVYAPFSSDLIDHLNRIVRFNTRAANPTCWELDVYASPDFRERMLADRAGDIVVLAGRNRGKIDSIQASVNAGLHVLADKPWVIASADLPKIDATLDDGRTQRRCRLRHHDRALRDHVHPAERARERSGRVRRDRRRVPPASPAYTCGAFTTS